MAILPPKLQPAPRANKRQRLAKEVRENAAALRADYDIPLIRNNDELAEHWPHVPGNFTKGFPHDEFGIVGLDSNGDASNYRTFIEFINQGRNSRPNFTNPDSIGTNITSSERVWESPLAGHVYDLEGPDGGELTIPPAPRLDSGELAAEMAEVYGLALLRDFPFSTIQSGEANPRIKLIQKEITDLKKKKASKRVTDKIAELTDEKSRLERGPSTAAKVNDEVLKVSWFETADADPRAEKRRIARRSSEDEITSDVLYRGSTDGAKVGPYISQFLLIGNTSRGAGETMTADAFNICPVLMDKNGKPRKISDGYILYGVQEIDQRFPAHLAGLDHMTKWDAWLKVQNGDGAGGDKFETTPRFITTPRDLATYVHYDQLYQAYLNACLLMLGYGLKADPGMPDAQSQTNVRDGFATFGGPHILSLVTEVATRALKHARRQKFNSHLRARPEAVAGCMTLSANGNGGKLGSAAQAVKAAVDATPSDLLDLVDKHNAAHNGGKDTSAPWKPQNSKNYLLPMAFPEGSPMHPSYAAGHASVAGACVTILKAFFKMFDPKYDDVCIPWTPLEFDSLHDEGIFEPTVCGTDLQPVSMGENAPAITIQGELDKLAANISIGRDMAGVHYYTDYYESLRLGERVAIGILQEQMLTYPEEVSMRLQTFDGENMIIEGAGDGVNVTVKVGKDGKEIGFEEWFTRID